MPAIDHRDQRLLELAPPGGLVGVDRDALADGRRPHQQLAGVRHAGVQRDAGGLIRVGQRQQQQSPRWVVPTSTPEEPTGSSSGEVSNGRAGIASNRRGSGADRVAAGP